MKTLAELLTEERRLLAYIYALDEKAVQLREAGKPLGDARADEMGETRAQLRAVQHQINRLREVKR